MHVAGCSFDIYVLQPVNFVPSDKPYDPIEILKWTVG